MRQKAGLLWVVLCLFIGVGQAQTEGPYIIGSVRDSVEKALRGVSISLHRSTDSALVKTALTDQDGRFRFEQLKAGTYLVKSSYTGYAPYMSKPLDLAAGARGIDLGMINLKPQPRELAAVVVQASRPFIEQKTDRMVVNVEAAVTNIGATVLEVLEKSPGITIDNNGNISLKGKQQVMVMVDGRPTYLGNTELTNLLKSMPASSIDQIEIMTNPSAKYDAAGNSGVINIKTKKAKQQGFNGSLTASYGQGQYWRTNNSFNLNYRTGKFNFFSNGGYSQWNNFQELQIERTFRDPALKEIQAIFEQTSWMRNHNQNYTLKLGADYYLNKKTTLGIVTSGFYNPEVFSSENTSYLKNAQGVTDSIVYSTSNNDNQWKNGSVNLNMRHQFDSNGRELSADLDYISYRATADQQFVNTTYDPKWAPLHQESLRGDLPVNIDIYSGKVDYTQTIAKKIKMEAGLKSSFVKTNNSAFYFNIYDNGESVDYSKTNQFNYRENINAAYISVSRQFKKLSVQAGLRYEHTRIEGLQYGNPVQADSAFVRNYGNLFPTMYLSYAASKNHQWGLNYGRRIDRPAYQDLNPFLFFIDKYTYQAGNPYIRPQFTDNIEFSHTFKGFLTTTLNYSYTKDYMTETFEQEQLPNGEESYATIVRQGNIGRRHNGGVAVSAQVPVKKWWTAILYTNLNYNQFSGDLNNERVDVAATNLLVNVNNQFRFGGGWAAELSGWYRTRGVDGQILINPMGQVSVGGTKQVMNGKGTLKLSVRDIFYSNIVSGNINFQNTEAWFRNLRDTRVANLSFVYRFGKQVKGTRQRRQTGGAGDEQNRVKLGNNN